MKKKYYCKKCNIEITRGSISGLCSSCSRIGNQFALKNGNCVVFSKCIDCGKQLKNFYAIRCKKHARVYQYKTRPETHPMLGKKGKEIYNWIEDRHLLEYPDIFNDELKEQIRKRDNYTCQNCGMTEEEHLIVIGTDLHVHHIDYNKENCKEDNLITVCLSCNTRANYNRNYWEEFYTQKIKEISKCKLS